MFTRTVAVVGAGYVGLTTAACLASLGHRVVCADMLQARIADLRRGVIPFVEPGLTELVREQQAAGRLQFVLGARHAMPGAQIVFLCVPTPMGTLGAADLAAVESVIDEVRHLLEPGCVVVNKSTVPVGTAVRTAALLGRDDVAVVSNPEFLREGSAVADFLHPDRIVVGCDVQDAAERVAALYTRLGAPTVLTDAASAEMVKYAANCFLAMKLSYINAMAELCERVGADILDVTEGIGHDRRIGQTFLAPGPGWGGSCLPKDTHALLQICEVAGFEFPLLRASLHTNIHQQHRMLEKIRYAVGGTLSGKRIGLLGLTFKAGTDDLRDSPALVIADLLRLEGAHLIGYDPAVPQSKSAALGLAIATDPRDVAAEADALVVLTEWDQFRLLDWKEVAELVNDRVIIDTRNLLDPDLLTRQGFTYYGVGTRPRLPEPAATILDNSRLTLAYPPAA